MRGSVASATFRVLVRAAPVAAAATVALGYALGSVRAAHPGEWHVTELANLNAAGAVLSPSQASSISLDGRFVVFGAFGCSDPIAAHDQSCLRDRVTGLTEWLTPAAFDGVLPRRCSPILTCDVAVTGGGHVNDDGRFVVFSTDAYNMVPGDRNGTQDIFVRDTLLDVTERVSVSNTEEEANGFSRMVSGSASTASSISGDGRYVVFGSVASNLTTDPDTNGNPDVFVRDRVAGTTELISVTPGGTTGNNQSAAGSISQDGRYVLFHSNATDLGPTSGEATAYIRDRVSETTEPVSLGPGGVTPNGSTGAMSMSANGRFVALVTWATNMVPGDTNATSDLLLLDRATSVLERVSVTTSGVQNQFPILDHVAVSAEGRFVAFLYGGGDLDEAYPDTNDLNDVYVRDRLLGTTQRASISLDGTQGDRSAQNGVGISGDGSVLYFNGFARNLVPNSTGDDAHIAVRTPLDTTPPVVSGSPDRPANVAGWYRAPVTIDWTAVDPEPASLPVSDPADTQAATGGAGIIYTSDPACDAAGNCATGSLALSIDLTPPSVGVPAFGVNPKSVSQTTTASATATDALSGVVTGEFFVGPDPGEGLGTPLSWDGTTLSGSIGTDLPPGVYTLSVRARDAADNWSTPSSAILVVYDPTGGFVTGGGWIVPGNIVNSDPGDLLPGLDGTSKANFGFVVKYQTGASTVPGGNLEFHYNVADFHLHSSDMAWLVVTNTNWARFSGTATIKGSDGLYPFRVDARDSDKEGSPDRFVIRIWAPGADPDTDPLLYKASGDVAGGQVVIHRE